MIDIIRTHPDVSTCNEVLDVDPDVVASAVASDRFTKRIAEQLPCLVHTLFSYLIFSLDDFFLLSYNFSISSQVMDMAERNLFVALKQEMFAGNCCIP